MPLRTKRPLKITASDDIFDTIHNPNVVILKSHRRGSWRMPAASEFDH